MEASGTSGMKAAANGVVNVSILDGWWDEAFKDAESRDVQIGWAINGAHGSGSADAADRADEAELFRVLEAEVVPAFYDRDDHGVPRAWMERAASGIREVTPFFTTHRMVRDYVDRYRQAATTSSGLPV